MVNPATAVTAWTSGIGVFGTLSALYIAKVPKESEIPTRVLAGVLVITGITVLVGAHYITKKTEV